MGTPACRAWSDDKKLSIIISISSQAVPTQDSAIHLSTRMCTPTSKTDTKQVTKSKSWSKRSIVTHNVDDSVWIERKVNFAGRQRSYFQSFKTGSCVWDEPPAGVSRIVKAHDLKKYPQLALYISTQVELPATSKPRGWFSMFRRNEGKAGY